MLYKTSLSVSLWQESLPGTLELNVNWAHLFGTQDFKTLDLETCVDKIFASLEKKWCLHKSPCYWPSFLAQGYLLESACFLLISQHLWARDVRGPLSCLSRMTVTLKDSQDKLMVKWDFSQIMLLDLNFPLLFSTKHDLFPFISPHFTQSPIQ